MTEPRTQRVVFETGSPCQREPARDKALHVWNHHVESETGHWQAMCPPGNNAGRPITQQDSRVNRAKKGPGGNQFSPCTSRRLAMPRVCPNAGLERAAPNVCIVATTKNSKKDTRASKTPRASFMIKKRTRKETTSRVSKASTQQHKTQILSLLAILIFARPPPPPPLPLG